MKLKNLTLYIIAAMIVFGIIYFGVNALISGHHTETSFALDTYINITTYKTGSDDAKQATALVDEIEQKMSAYIPDSEVSELNASAKKDTAIRVSDELFEILKTAYEYSEITDGLFDITIKPVTDLWSISKNPRVPSEKEISKALESVGYKYMLLNETDKTVTFLKDNMQIDLGAIAKGYSADRVVEFLRLKGRRALIDLGGNISIIGENRNSKNFFTKTVSPWRIGIQTPFAPEGEYCLIVSVSVLENETVSVVTSGAYERNFEQDGILYHHIFDPTTGHPFNGEAESVTIIGEKSMQADALSTSAYMMKPQKAMNMVRLRGYDCIIIDKNKKIHTTLDKSRIEIVDENYFFAD